MKHFFLYIFDRPDDPFAGLKELLRHSSGLRHEVHELQLSRRSYELINKIDYSRIRKRLRFLYYRQVFKELEDSLTFAVQGCGKNDVAVVYFSDDGVWAEFWKQFRARVRAQVRIVGVNVQHGWLKLEPASGIAVRRGLNAASRALVGFPTFGLGSLGGSGCGVFDVYLVYSPEAAAFVTGRTGDRAYSCPAVIKHQLSQSFNAARTRARAAGHSCDDVLMALQPPPFVGLRAGATVLEMMREWLPIARMLKQDYQRHVVIRRHPGIAQDLFDQNYRESGISAYAEADTQAGVQAALARSQIVFSYMSTVLFEAALFGLTPVSVCGGLFDDHLASLPHVRLDLSKDLRQQIELVLHGPEARRFSHSTSASQFDWEGILLDVLGEPAEASRTVGASSEYPA